MTERSGTRTLSRPRLVVAALALSLGLAGAGCATQKARVLGAHAAAASAPALSSSERTVVNEVNRFRAAHGLRALVVNPNLEEKARTWVVWMASGNCGRTSGGSPAICHSDLASGITVPWTRLEENVASASPASNLAGALSALERSSEHVANMLNRTITSMGAGVFVAGGTVFVAEEFMAQ